MAVILAAERDRAVDLVAQHREAIENLAERLVVAGRLAGEEVAAALAHAEMEAA